MFSPQKFFILAIASHYSPTPPLFLSLLDNDGDELLDNDGGILTDNG